MRATRHRPVTPTPTSAHRGCRAGCLALWAELAALRAEHGARLAALEAAIVNVAHVHNLPPDDVGLLSALARLGRAFSAAELLAHAAVDPELAVALGGVTSPKRIGKRLRRLSGQEIAGYTLTRITRDAHGTIWQVTT